MASVVLTKEAGCNQQFFTLQYIYIYNIVYHWRYVADTVLNAEVGR